MEWVLPLRQSVFTSIGTLADTALTLHFICQIVFAFAHKGFEAYSYDQWVIWLIDRHLIDPVLSYIVILLCTGASSTFSSLMIIIWKR